MNVLLVNLIILSKSCTKTCGVKNGTGTDDVFLRKSGNFVESIGKYVNRIAYKDVDSIRSVTNDVRDNGFGDVDVGLCQFKTSLTGLSGNAGGKNNPFLRGECSPLLEDAPTE